MAPWDSDRRDGNRLNMIFSVYISGAWGNSFGIARNISEGGMFIETPEPYPLGGRMLITFSQPGSDLEMSMVGEVIHLCFVNRTAGGGERHSISGMGIRFVGFEQQESIERPMVTSALIQ